MTDEDQARSALAEVARRREETTRIAGRGTSPTWLVAAGVVVLFLLALVSDLRTQNPEWNGWFTRWAVPAIGIAIIASLAVVAYRRASASLHCSAAGKQMATAAIVGVSYYVCLLAIGMPMRYYRIPFDQTVSFVGATLIVTAGWLVWRSLRGRRS